MNNLSVPRIGSVESALPMRLERVDLSARPVAGLASFVGDLEIRGVGTGTRALDVIARKILREKLRLRSSLLRRVDWEGLLVAPVVVYFDGDKPLPGGDYERNFAQLFRPASNAWRRDRVLQYAKALDETWAPPLFVSSLVLRSAAVPALTDWLRPRRRKATHEECPFMVDGSKRISARAVRGEKACNASVIITKPELTEWIDEAGLQRIRDLARTVTWFPHYQSMPEVSLEEGRSSERYRAFDLRRIRGKSIVDFGCNIGQSCFEFHYYGAAEVTGFDVQSEAVEVANLISKELGLSQRVKFFRIDFNDPQCFDQMDSLLPDAVDFASFLAMYRTKELTQRDKLFSYILSKVRQSVFFEGHRDEKIDTIDYYERLFAKFGLQARFLGHAERGLRPQFELTRKSPASEHAGS